MMRRLHVSFMEKLHILHPRSIIPFLLESCMKQQHTGLEKRGNEFNKARRKQGRYAGWC